MLDDDKYWKNIIMGTELEIRLKRKYSFSDRCRYYMPLPNVNNTKYNDQQFKYLWNSIKSLSQFMPIQYTKYVKDYLKIILRL